MSTIRNMIDAIESENFDNARCALKTSLAEYMAGIRYVSNKDVFGDGNTDPNEENRIVQAGLAESETLYCDDCKYLFGSDEDSTKCPQCGSTEIKSLNDMTDEEINAIKGD